MAARLMRTVAVAAVGLLAACGSAPDGGRPARGPAPPGVAESMLLGPDEFGGSGWRTDPDPAQSPSGWAFAMPYCATYAAADYPAQEHRDGVRTRAFGYDGQSAEEWVEHFAPGWAARGFDDVRRVVGSCERYEYGDRSPAAEGFLESHWVEATGFAGDESILVGSSRIDPSSGSFHRYTAMVRVGDLAVTLAVTDPRAEVDAGQVRELARRAATHLEK